MYSVKFGERTHWSECLCSTGRKRREWASCWEQPLTRLSQSYGCSIIHMTIFLVYSVRNSAKVFYAMKRWKEVLHSYLSVFYVLQRKTHFAQCSFCLPENCDQRYKDFWTDKCFYCRSGTTLFHCQKRGLLTMEKYFKQWKSHTNLTADNTRSQKETS